MKFRLEVICLGEDGAEHRSVITELERRELAIETLGLNLAEAKAILGNVQDFMTPDRSLTTWSSGGNARNAGSGTTAKAAAQRQSTRCSGQLRF